MNKHTGIIFDFNGTMFWDTPFHEKAWNEMAMKMIGKKLSKKELAQKMYGRTNTAIIEFVLGRKISSEESKSIANEKETLYRNICLQNIEKLKFAPGLEELLNHLKEKNIPMTIATSSDKDNVDFFIEQFQLEKWFDTEKIIFNNDSLAGKPAPDIFLKALKAINIGPRNCIVFEDSPSGFLAAHNAGIDMIIAVASNKNFEEDYYKHAHKIINNFHEININQILN